MMYLDYFLVWIFLIVEIDKRPNLVNIYLNYGGCHLLRLATTRVQEIVVVTRVLEMVNFAIVCGRFVKYYIVDPV